MQDNNLFSLTAEMKIALKWKNRMTLTGLTWVMETFMLQDSLAEANKLEQEDRVIWEPL